MNVQQVSSTSNAIAYKGVDVKTGVKAAETVGERLRSKVNGLTLGAMLAAMVFGGTAAYEAIEANKYKNDPMKSLIENYEDLSPNMQKAVLMEEVQEISDMSKTALESYESLMKQINAFDTRKVSSELRKKLEAMDD